MSTPEGYIKLGEIYPNPNRHRRIMFTDQGSGVEHILDNLITDPDDSDWQMATLITNVGGMPPLTAVWRTRLIREASLFVATVEQSQVELEAFVSKIAVGSLWVRHKGRFSL
jgi:hypothetical protein